MESLAKRIKRDITRGTFSYSNYFPDSPRARAFEVAPQASQGVLKPAPSNPENAILFAQAAEDWFIENQPRWRSTNAATTRSILDHRLLPTFGEVSVALITRAELLAFRAQTMTATNRKEQETLSASRVNHIIIGNFGSSEGNQVTTGPQRIVCLTEEPTETLYLLGEQDRIVGISGFTVRPPAARREKPKVSAFTSAKIEKILALSPDLAIGFSDIQADIASELIRSGVEVWISNHRSVEGILDYIRRLGALVGASKQAHKLSSELEFNIREICNRSEAIFERPRVYFEEWDSPQISSIQWVAELIRIAGGDDIFPEISSMPLARDRILEDPMEVVRRAPDIIIGSWCGKKFRPDSVASRPGWQDIPAVRDGELHEIKSVDILQPGPAALTDGLSQLARIIGMWARQRQKMR